jgi:drug/metabolite transporter (DMT)-like permease
MVHVALILVQVFFASLAIAGRYVLKEFPAGALVLCRVVGASGVLAAVYIASGRERIRRRRHILDFAILGLLGVAINQGLYIFALRHTTAINATILTTTTPIFTLLWAALAGDAALSAAKLTGVGLAAAGVVYLIGPDRLSLGHDVALGNAMIVVGMACYSAYFVLSKRIVRVYRPLTVTTYAMLFGALGTLPFGIPSALSIDPARIHTITWIWVAYIVLFPTVAAYLLNIWALRRVSSNTVAVYIYLQPLLAGAVAPLVLRGEVVTLRTVVAGLAIFAGLAVVLRSEGAGQRKPAAA